MGERFIPAGKQLLAILRFATFRFYDDNGLSRAAALAYTTLFSLVPLVALSLSVFTAFGFNAEDFTTVLETVFNQILPPMDEGQSVVFQTQVIEYLQHFSTLMTAKSLNALSIGVLVVSTIALLNTIESALNSVWRVKSNIPIMHKISRNWSVITLGPILIGLSIFITTKFKLIATQTIGAEIVAVVGLFIPTVVSSLALLLLYATMPATKIRFRDAALGGFVGAVLFEAVKSGFAYYLTLTSSYSTLYGVLAAVPLFLFWMYVAWVVVIYGAEVAYAAGNLSKVQSK